MNDREKPPRNLTRLAGSTYLLRGSPVTIVYKDNDTAYVIDPGHGSRRTKQLRQALNDLKVNRIIALITHYHSDHLGITSKLNPDETVAPEQDALFVKDPELRILVTFGYPIPPGHPSLPFDAPGVNVSTSFTPGAHIGPLETVHLPGHTPGQVGVVTPDNVLYLADAAFGLRVLENYYIPYHLDYPKAVNTLHKIRDEIARDVNIIVFGHGPLVSKSEAVSIIEENIRHHEKVSSKIIESAPTRSVEELVINILRKAGKQPTLQLVLLATGSVKSIIAREYGLDLADDRVIAKDA
ncbi:MAG: MBL fold metallo-hydrolase [Desulfurococcales archaeon]|nr:MBL fold metallo-hydrolase [Desulfurococcales archaeon]